MVREYSRENGFYSLTTVVGEGHILFLVDGLQLGMEAAEHGLDKAVGLDTSPVVYLIGGYILDIAGDVLRCIGIGAVGANGRHKFVVLVGNGYERSLIAYRVYLMVDGGTLCAVGGLTIDLEKVLDLVQQRFLGFVVRGSEIGRSLEHQVLEVVCQTGCLGGIVFAAYAHGNIGLDTRLVLIDGHVQSQAVGQRVHQRLGRVVGYRLVLITVCRSSECGQHRQGHNGKRSENKLHNVNVMLVLSYVSLYRTTSRQASACIATEPAKSLKISAFAQRGIAAER